MKANSFVTAFAVLAGLALAAPAAPLVCEDVEPHNDTAPGVTKRTDAPYGIKKGLAYNDGSKTSLLARSGSATWAYNWGAARLAPKFQQIPMYWGPGSLGDKSGVNAKIDAGNTPWVLGYNEPDEKRENGGCAKSPREAYDAWGRDMFAFRNRGSRLVCPAVSSFNTMQGHTGGPAGLQWLRQFVGLAGSPANLQCDAQALHWFGVQGRNGAEQARLFIDYITYARGQVNDIFRRDMPIWVTEFAPLPIGNAQIMADFLRIVMPWMNRQDWIHRYSPFMAEHLVSGTSLNVAGNVFVGTS